MRRLVCAIAVSLLCLVAIDGRAQSVTDSAFCPQFRPAMHVERRNGPITIDGDISDEGWQHAATTTGSFTCSVPIPCTKPPHPTSAKITYDDEYLYIAMIADDPDPQSIRSSRVSRDNIFDDDFMGIIIDTYGDASRAFEIYCNPLGIQGDLFWSGNGNEDLSYDLIYESDAKITDSGWQIEMKIPFRSLRFPDRTEQDFHISFWRSYPRESIYKMSWSAISFQIPCVFCQLGTLTGIDHIRPAGSYELLPSLVASQAALGDDRHVLVNDKVSIRPSLGVRYALGTATSVEATVKPDFSQVESDATQISANTTLALYYPEHRPFFQDGADALNTNIPAIYTRSINAPLVAAKAIYRNNATSITYLGGLDEHSPMLIPLPEKTILLPDLGRSISNILRATYSFGDNRAIGALVTNRSYSEGGMGTVAGIDGHAQLFENVELNLQSLYSYTRESNSRSVGSSERFNLDRHTLEFDGEHFGGIANFVGLQRYTPGLDVMINYTQSTQSFRAPNGFIASNGTTNVNSFIGYKVPMPNPPAFFKWVVEVDGSFSTNTGFDETGRQILMSFKPELDFSFVGQTDFHVYYRASNERFHGVQLNNAGYVDVFGSTKPAGWLHLNWDVTYGRNIVRQLDTPTMGRELDISLSAKLKPIGGLLIEPNFAFSRLDSEHGSGHYYSGAIYRAKVTYQFSKALSARLVIQYDEFARVLEIDPLITYQINPFTSVYVGSAHDYASFDPNSRTLYPSERHLFAKLQYLIEG